MVANDLGERNQKAGNNPAKLLEREKKELGMLLMLAVLLLTAFKWIVFLA